MSEDNSKKIVIGKVKILLRGEYNSHTTYYELDLIAYKGSSYICKKECVNIDPTDTEYWQVLAEKGEKGNTGDKGHPGADGKDGSDIANIEKTAINGLVDTYTITLTDGSTHTFYVTNGKDGFNSVDDELSTESTNPLQNKVIAEKLKSVEKSLNTKTLDIIVPSGSIITNETLFDTPKYIVGSNLLEVYWDGVRLIKATATSDGHYEEIGQAGTVSTQIKMHRTAEDGNYTLEEEASLTIVVRGEVVE